MTTTSRNDVEAIYPLSPMQQGLLFHSLVAPHSGVYMLQFYCTLRGTLDEEALRSAWSAIVARHGVLRTFFVLDHGDKPLQIVRTAVDLPFERQDWTETPENEQAGRFFAALKADRGRGFDVTKGPLFRLAVIKTAADVHQLVWSIHHAVVDGWSISQVFREVFSTYEALRRGERLALPPVRPYVDYVAWLGEQGATAAEAFWRRTMKGFDTPLALPADGETRDAADEEDRSHKLQFTILPAKTAALKELARRQQVTLNTVMQGAWALLLSRYTGTDDVVFGATVSGRPTSLPGAESMVGLFINTLPVRVQVPRETAVGPWLRALQSQQAELRQYEYSSLVDVQGWSDVPRGRAVFDTLLLFESFPSLRAGLPAGASLTISEMNCFDVTHYAVTLSVTPGDQLVMRLLYDRRVASDGLIARMAEQFEQVLEALVGGADAPVANIGLLSATERRRVLQEFNQTAAVHGGSACMHSLFEVQAWRDTPAVISDHETLSYQELNRRANRLAHRLIGFGVRPGTLVGICLDRTPGMIVSLLAVLKAGGAYVPLDPAYPADRLAFMLDDAAVAVLITDRQLAPRVPLSATRILYLEEDQPALDAQSTANPAVAVSPHDLAYVIYTSGSTGRPKGTQIPHLALTNLLRSVQKTPGLDAHDRLLAVTTLSFDIAGLELYLPLITGAAIVLVGRETAASAPDLQARMVAHQPTMMQATPATWRMLVEHGWAGSPELTLLCGGEALPRELARALVSKGRAVWNMYGPTETTIWSTSHQVSADDRVVSIGKPLANTQVYVLDPQLGPVPVGVPGELYIGGTGVARGYLHQPALTAERFVPDPFGGVAGARMYRTGDLVSFSADGSLVFIARLDHQVKLRGYRIELGEVESVLVQHEQVRQAVAIIREDEPGDQRLIAYVVPAAQGACDIGSLQALAAERLPAYMVPAAFVLLEALPLTPNGKVNRQALPAPDRQRQVTDRFLAPRTALENQIAGIWAEVLRIEHVGIRDNFFELGGHSLLLMRAHAKIVQALGREVAILDCFQHPTIESLVQHLGLSGGPAKRRRAERRPGRRSAGDEAGQIAVIGMSGRFPGAADLDAFWSNLAAGVESIRTFTDAELSESGVPEVIRNHPAYVRARGVVDGADLFDAPFFGYTPREAQLMDPQQRLFLECAWEALERAAYDPHTYDGLIGVYAGSSVNAYALGLFGRPEVASELGPVGILLNSDKDYLPTRVSYKLNLRGPSVNVQAACSTSLVAVHEACASLLSYQCDMALAGGVSVSVPLHTGYMYQDGGIVSPDGHCRAFDAEARGTLGGSGVGVVVLKRLADAIADGDAIRAVIRGSAVNNDGSTKAGFTAPSADGQAEVIAMAYAAADTAPDSIGYVEAHGTGTLIGDPIEVKALTQAFREHTDKRRFCALGSVKTNIGHLDAAAGVAGFIKTVLALEHRQLPPSLHFETPNPRIDFENGPFRVNTSLVPWPVTGETPRRAGVSSFGLGGTNAHVVLEEAPPAPPTAAAREWQILTLSARTPGALEAAAARLADYLEMHPHAVVADVAFSLQAGRHAFAHRRIVVCRDCADAVRLLREGDPRGLLTRQAFAKTPSIVFMFPGQGSQTAGMGADLYRDEPVFRETVDACREVFLARLGVDLRHVIDTANEPAGRAEGLLARTSTTQAALFAVELALARLWMSWGVVPDAMIGHSIGEYVAACLSGVLTLQDAAALVAVRGQLMDQAPSGRMLAVPLPVSAIQPMLSDGVWVAAVNAADQCVLSGQSGRIGELETQLAAKDIACQPLRTSGAFHSGLMAAVMEPLTEAVRRVKRGRITIPYLSNVTGTWITEADLDPSYWARHVRSTVQFAAGVDTMLSVTPLVCLEVGPGQTLSGLARRHASAADGSSAIVASLGHRGRQGGDGAQIARAVGEVWLAGVRPDWSAVHAPHRRRRVDLPTYPFERKRHWMEARAAGDQPAAAVGPLRKRPAVESWLYAPSWKRSASRLAPGIDEVAGRRFLVFTDETGLADRVGDELTVRGATVVRLVPGDRFADRGAGRFTVRRDSADDYDALHANLRASERWPDAVLHFWNLDPAGANQPARLSPFFDLLAYLRSLGGQEVSSLDLTVITSPVSEVIGGEALDPVKATALGPCRVMPLEHPAVVCRHLDLVAEEWTGPSAGRLDALLGELCARGADRAVASRRGRRWVLTYEPTPIPAPATPAVGLRQGGVYLITGGTGGIGLEIAAHLARTVSARLVLTSRRGLPERNRWADHLRDHGADDPISQAIRAVQSMEQAGADVMVAAAHVTDGQRMRDVVLEARERFGRIDGVVHAAGVAGGGLIQLKTREAAAAVLAPKVAGTFSLSGALEGDIPDFVMLCSSVTAVTGGVGQVDYCAANAFLDSFAQERTREGHPTVSVCWDTWQEVGMAVTAEVPAHLARQRDEALKQGMTSREALDAFGRILAGATEAQVVVSTRELLARLAPPPASAPLDRADRAAHADPRPSDSTQDRPDLPEAYVGPRHEIDEAIAEVWQRLFGMSRVGIHDNFFDLGGHSLLATQLVSRVRAEFHVEMRLDTLFDAPTVAGLSDHILEKLIEQDGDAAGDLLAGIEALSDDEIRSQTEAPGAARVRQIT